MTNYLRRPISLTDLVQVTSSSGTKDSVMMSSDGGETGEVINGSMATAMAVVISMATAMATAMGASPRPNRHLASEEQPTLATR